MTEAARLNCDRITFFGLTCRDRPVGYGLVGIASQDSINLRETLFAEQDTNIESRPAEMDLSLGKELDA
jgi:hypothetical protein